MDMTKEALALIQTTAQEAQKAEVLPIPGDGRTVCVRIGNAVQSYIVEPPCRNHQVFSLKDLSNYAGQVVLDRGKDVTSAEEARPVVWHGPEGVTLVLDDQDRRDRVTFNLTTSDEMDQLLDLAESKPFFDQKAFIRMLRCVFNLDTAIIAMFRKLDWEHSSRTTAEAERGRDRLGNEVQSKVQGTAELPEFLDIVAPVYREVGEREEYTIRCLLEFDTVNARIQLIPTPGELDHAFELAQASIHKRLVDGLADEGVPVYYGKP